MSYSYLRECLSNGLHNGIDYVIPTHPLIGAIAGYVGYYSYGWMIVYSPQILVSAERGKFQAIFGWFASCAPTYMEQKLNLSYHASNFGSWLGGFSAPVSLPTTIAFLADKSHIIAALATSLILNLIAQRFFGIPIKKEGKKVEHLMQSLDRMGISMAQNTRYTPPPSTQATCDSFFKDIHLPPESDKPIVEAPKNT